MTDAARETAVKDARAAAELLAGARAVLQTASLPPFALSSLERVAADAATLADLLAALLPPPQAR